ncbi:MAG: hypothetical protein FWG29_01770 [Treponema sp.]|nr:hypothetical protein [Treponema sp.]
MFGQDGATITLQDLAEVKANFAGRPPLTLGHIPHGQTEGPRYGRVLSVDLAENGHLLLGKVEFGDVADDAYAKGLYDGWSVSIPRRGKDGTRYLHSLALLGETPPKIPGLKETETVSYEYADGDQIETYTFGGTIQELKEDNSVDPAKETEELKKKAEALEAENKKLREEKEAAEKASAEAAATPPAETKPEPAAGPENTDFSDRLAKMEGEVRKSRVETLMAKVSGKIPEGLKDKVKGLASRIARDDESFNFSDGGKDTSAKAVELLGDILTQWPAPVKPGVSGIDFADPESGKAPDWSKVAAGI